MSELPVNWLQEALSDISWVEMGQSPDSRSYNDRGDGLPFFQGKSEFGKLYPTVRKWCTEPKKIAEAGDILLSVRAPVGPTNLAVETCCIGRGLAGVRSFPPFNQRFLLYHFRNIESWLSGQGTGTTFTAISGDFIRTLEVPVAPLNEQNRITDKLDNLLGRVDACEEHLARVPQILKRFRQAVLAAAITSGLTLEDVIDNENYQPLSEVIKRIKTGPFGSALHKSDYISDGIPLVNPMHINNGRITPSNDMTISEKKAIELQEFRLSRGDIVLARRGIMGRCAVVGEREENWLCGSGSMLLHPTELVLPEYLQLFLSSPGTVENLEANSVGSTMSNLNQKILLDLMIRVPSILEQQEIVERVELLFAFADRLEERWRVAHGSVAQLMPALLAKAFRGDLVDQDPEDEPAVALLEKIRKERETGKQI